MKQRLARQSADEWVRLLARFEKSGLSPVEFGQQEDLSLATFRRWRSRPAAQPSQKADENAARWRQKKPGLLRHERTQTLHGGHPFTQKSDHRQIV